MIKIRLKTFYTNTITDDTDKDHVGISIKVETPPPTTPNELQVYKFDVLM